MHCPKLFIDENANQILPVEGVYVVYEVKTTLTKSILEEAFQNLSSVYEVAADRPNRSNNDFVEFHPPGLAVIAFSFAGQLDKLCKDYIEFNKKYNVTESFHFFSEKSPGFKEFTGDKYLVYEVSVLDKGAVFHMHNGSAKVSAYGEYTLGILLTDLIKTLNWIDLPKVDLLDYFNYLMVEAMGKE
jgi:hypothetical protein